MTQENQPTSIERTQRWLRDSPTVKLFIIGFIILLLLIPLTFVQDLVRERQQRQYEAEQEISQTWGQEQIITGPFITIPYYEKTVSEPGVLSVQTSPSYAHFLPDKLDFKAELQSEVRSRGIFDVVVYTSVVTITGSFSKPDMTEFYPYETLMPRAQLQLGLNDMHSMIEMPVVEWGGNVLPIQPGVDHAEIIDSGMSAPLNLVEGDKEYQFSITLKMRGTRGLQMIPLGKETTAYVTGNWGSPSFQGSLLPEKKEISESAFSANWKTLYMNRSYPQQFKGPHSDIYTSAFGVNLLLPITDYQKNERSAKYAVLIIALTFMVFFFVQVLNKVRIHGIQFLLAGLALCLFYVLLLSFTEHIGFNLAYLSASLLTISLVTLYIKAIFKNTRLTAINFLLLVLVYGFVFVIIQLEEYALLVGSLGLFAVLATAMYLSRNITWTDQLQGSKD